MLEQIACHSGFDIRITVKSLDKDQHHLVEDRAIAFGKAFSQAVCEKSGINRYGQCVLPMDDALVLCALDVSGRAYATTGLELESERVSDFETILVPHFFNSFAQNAGITLHIKQLNARTAFLENLSQMAPANGLNKSCGIKNAKNINAIEITTFSVFVTRNEPSKNRIIVSEK